MERFLYSAKVRIYQPIIQAWLSMMNKEAKKNPQKQQQKQKKKYKKTQKKTHTHFISPVK
jgi:hypothetical protein